MDRHIASRRALLGTVVAIGAAAVVPAATAAGMPKETVGPPLSSISPELASLISKADRLEEIAGRYERDVFGPASARFDAAKEVIPHVSFEASYVTASGGRPTLSTERPDQMATAASLVARPLDWFGEAEGAVYYRDKRKLLAASKWRERAIAHARRASGVDEAYDTSWELGDVAAEGRRCGRRVSCRCYYFALMTGISASRVVQAGDLLSDRAFHSRVNPWAAGTAVNRP